MKLIEKIYDGFIESNSIHYTIQPTNLLRDKVDKIRKRCGYTDTYADNENMSYTFWLDITVNGHNDAVVTCHIDGECKDCNVNYYVSLDANEKQDLLLLIIETMYNESING